MISVQQAEALIFDHMPALGSETVPLADSIGRLLTEPVRAERDQPPFDRAMMDGFALASQDNAKHYEIVAIAPAGQPTPPLSGPGQCIEIMTGAAVPQGADCVIPVEQVVRDGNRITFSQIPQSGACIHPRASDHPVGTQLLAAGTWINAPEMAVLASSGKPDVSVRKLPKIAVVASGDELVDVGQPVNAEQIRRSNDYALQALLHRHRLACCDRFHIPDEPVSLQRQLARLLRDYDGLVLTGGVSMGRYDYIPAVLTALGVELIFHKVSQRPGKPMWFGSSTEGVPVFALPGNPVSALVCARRYVVPALQAGKELQPPKNPTVMLTKELPFKPDLTGFIPVVLDSQRAYRATPVTTNTSGDFTALAGTSGFVQLDRGQDHFAADQALSFYPW